MKYFLRNNEKEFLSISLQELKQLTKNKDLNDLYYWHQGMADWEKFDGSNLQTKIAKDRRSTTLLTFITSVVIFAIIGVIMVSINYNNDDSSYTSTSEEVVVETDEDIILEDYESQSKNINESSINSNSINEINNDKESQGLKDVFAGKNNYNYDDINYEPVKNFKYVYIVFDVSIPKELGYNEGMYDSSLGINIKGTYYPIYEDSQLISDVLEIEDYSEDLKHRLFDSFESQNIEPSGFPSLRASNSQGIFEYRAKVLQRNIYVFDSYSEASKHRRKKL
ncbi:DUF4339 domain-containing protein [Weeksellaceae bacterium KMM 9724]|uniref:hypothetical protein n=1 Tax=Profundicola chukchiensis TaxID=2961959 RepID=UPI00243CF514|nr:hypothetical protein [Profundicola chukchiensis]MDG4950479.1 DUF4339 domain-containing protein [Profundicola chukchiensis]